MNQTCYLCDPIKTKLSSSNKSWSFSHQVPKSVTYENEWLHSLKIYVKEQIDHVRTVIDFFLRIIVE